MKHITAALLLMLLLAGCATPKITSSPVNPMVPENFRDAGHDEREVWRTDARLPAPR